MKHRPTLLLLLAMIGVVPPLPAAPVTLEDLLGDVDTTALAELTGLEEAQLQQASREIQRQWQGKYEIPPPVRAWLAEWGIDLEPRFIIAAPPLELPVPPPPPVVPPFWVGRSRADRWPVPARAFVPRLKPIFVAAGVPAELVWLAEVESRFNPRARSRVGAVGLYQLMPDTAEWLGLATQPHDERLDPDKNARAAAQYLSYLHDRFADWPLVVAAYNGGEGRVRRLLDQRRARTFAAIATGLPMETQTYVARVEAALAAHEGLFLHDLPPPHQFGE